MRRLCAITALLLMCTGCAAPDGSQAPPLGDVTVRLAGAAVAFDDAACTWYEDTGQLFVEAGDAEGDDYVLLAAPLQWLGQELPEGPGEPPELTLRRAGRDLPVDLDTLDGTMTSDQTTGTFSAALADGTPLDGEWRCPEVLEE